VGQWGTAAFPSGAAGDRKRTSPRSLVPRGDVHRVKIEQEEQMSKLRERLEKEMQTLRTLRDELRVQAELGRLEARGRWDELERQWNELEGKLKMVGEGAREDAAEVGEAAQLLLEELRKGYRHFKDRL
jgi:hypothetical protein